MLVEKWAFMADWCKKMGYNPHDKHFWQMAEKAWDTEQQDKRTTT